MSTIIVNMDSAFRAYMREKRNSETNIFWGYDKSKKEFVELKSCGNSSDIVNFIDCYSVANEVIDAYLNQGGMEEHKNNFKNFYETGNRVTDILLYFNDIDGAYPFEGFECLYVVDVIRNWCKEHRFGYTKMTIYPFGYCPGNM